MEPDDWLTSAQLPAAMQGESGEGGREVSQSVCDITVKSVLY